MQKNVFVLRQTEHWNRLPREVVGILSLEMPKKNLDVVLRGMVEWRNIGDRWTVELEDPGGFFQP